MQRFDEAIEVYRDAIETRPEDFLPHSLYNLLGEKLTSLSVTDLSIVNLNREGIKRG